MLSQEQLYCTQRETMVEVLVESQSQGKNARQKKRPVSCARACECPKTTFCRFVNPLTTRNPLQAKEEAA